MNIVGFLKFLNRGKKGDSAEDLDLPPAPPPLDGMESQNSMPDFPDLSSDSDMGNLGQQKEDDFPQAQSKQDEQEMQDFPQLPDFEDFHGGIHEEPHDLHEQSIDSLDLPQISMPEGDLEEHHYEDYPVPKQDDGMGDDTQNGFDMPDEPQSMAPKPMQIIKERPKPQVTEKRRLFTKVQNEQAQESLFIRVDKFRNILGNVNTIRSDLKKYEDSLENLQRINNSKNNSSEKIKSMLNDLQKKIIFIDRTLFKGGD